MKTFGIVAVCLVAGFLGGRFLAPSHLPSHEGGSVPGPEAGAAQVWTCSMHPQIRLPQPGACPICGMDLVPAASGGSGDGTVILGEGAQRIASIAVEPVARRSLEHEVRTVAKIETAEPLVAHLSARIDGRIERLYVDFTGIRVSKGDHLVDIYSPDLLLAQTEFLLASRHLEATPPGGAGRTAAETSLEASRQKLLLWGITPDQIGDLKEEGKAHVTLTLLAPVGGVVIQKNIREGAYVKTGDPLYTIADLSTLWAYADIYEYELPWVEPGQDATLEVEGAPGQAFSGTVAFVDPVVNESTRTVRVRINLPNPEGRLKPGMFAKVLIRSRLGPDGTKAPSPLAGKFACPMHPDVVSDAAGDCRICGMPLEKIPDAPAPGAPVWTCPMHPEVREAAPGRCPICKMKLVEAQPSATGDALAVPVTAVLDTGNRRVVYVEREPGKYEAREVTLGPRAGDYYPALSGLAEGDRVVVHGNFLLDSQAQIEGKPSLLFPKGLSWEAPPPAGHEGHAAP